MRDRQTELRHVFLCWFVRLLVSFLAIARSIRFMSVITESLVRVPFFFSSLFVRFIHLIRRFNWPQSTPKDVMSSVAGLPLGAAADDEYAMGMKRLRAAKEQQAKDKSRSSSNSHTHLVNGGGDGGGGGIGPGDGFAHPFGSIGPAGYERQKTESAPREVAVQQLALVKRCNDDGDDGNDGNDGNGDVVEWGGVSLALDELRRKVATLEKELYDEKLRTTALKEERRRPLNIHRWNAVRHSIRE